MGCVAGGTQSVIIVTIVQMRPNTTRPQRHGGKKIALRGGDTEAHFPNPPPSLAAVTGWGVQGGGARPAVPGGGGGQPNIYGSK